MRLLSGFVLLKQLKEQIFLRYCAHSSCVVKDVQLMQAWHFISNPCWLESQWLDFQVCVCADVDGPSVIPEQALCDCGMPGNLRVIGSNTCSKMTCISTSGSSLQWHFQGRVLSKQ